MEQLIVFLLINLLLDLTEQKFQILLDSSFSFGFLLLFLRDCHSFLLLFNCHALGIDKDFLDFNAGVGVDGRPHQVIRDLSHLVDTFLRHVGVSFWL